MLKRVRTLSLKGFTVRLVMDSKVYLPSFTTRLIAENLPDLNGLDVLDLGTGSGILAIVASKLGARKIIATDISRRALANASINLKINDIENVELRYGSLYQPVEGETFNVIISNPPMTPSIQPFPRYTWGGVDGRIMLDKIILDAPKHLREKGRLIIPTISLIGIGKTWMLLNQMGFKVNVLGYGWRPFGKRLIKIKDYIDKLEHADYFYDNLWRPCWRVILYEAILS
jgi:HemK-related putative methylase